jgi:hypothetical protein
VPEIEIENVRGDDFVVSTRPVLFFDKVDELVVDTGSVGEPEGRPRRQLVEKDELLLVRHPPVIAFLSLGGKK